ncbi:MAG: hypothetical protein ACPIA7_04705 [Akkermansiaceae bacterium]
MKSRFNHYRHNLHCRSFDNQNEAKQLDQSPPVSTQITVASQPRWNHAELTRHEPHAPSDTDNDTSAAELNDFCLSCIEQLSLSKPDGSRDSLLKQLISEKLPSYTELMADLNKSYQRYQQHHDWTQQMYRAVEPLLQKKTNAVSEQHNLNQLTLQCVEQDMQLQYRVEQLKMRVAYIQQSVSQQLTQIGSDVGLPKKIMVKLAKLIVQAMQR